MQYSAAIGTNVTCCNEGVEQQHQDLVQNGPGPTGRANEMEEGWLRSACFAAAPHLDAL